MASKELIEKVARELCEKQFGNQFFWRQYQPEAEIAISTILAALQEPTEAMLKSGQSFYTGSKPFQVKCWRAMLTASALGEQSE